MLYIVSYRIALRVFINVLVMQNIKNTLSLAIPVDKQSHSYMYINQSFLINDDADV